MTNKKCCYCKEIKDISYFSTRNTCKKCQSKQANDSIIRRFGSYRAHNIFNKYGITLEDYDRMYEEQKGLCKICEQNKTLVVDHSHKTEEVRGLLCTACNTAIGLLKENPNLFDKAKEYIL